MLQLLNDAQDDTAAHPHRSLSGTGETRKVTDIDFAANLICQCPLRVKSRSRVTISSCPLLPQQQTFERTAQSVEKCHEPTSRWVVEFAFAPLPTNSSNMVRCAHGY